MLLYPKISVEADGYGTLILPHATYSNTLRVKTVETYADYAMGSPFISYETISHFWYTPDEKDFVAKHAEVYIAGQKASETFHHTRTYPTNVRSVTDIDASLNIFPNPATDLLQIHFTADTKKAIGVQLYDVTGRAVQPSRQINANPGVNEIKLNTAGIVSGIYFIKLSSGSAMVNRKIEIRQ